MSIRERYTNSYQVGDVHTRALYQFISSIHEKDVENRTHLFMVTGFHSVETPNTVDLQWNKLY